MIECLTWKGGRKRIRTPGMGRCVIRLWHFLLVNFIWNQHHCVSNFWNLLEVKQFSLLSGICDWFNIHFRNQENSKSPLFQDLQICWFWLCQKQNISMSYDYYMKDDFARLYMILYDSLENLDANIFVVINTWKHNLCLSYQAVDNKI